MIAKNQETDIPLDERISLFKKGNYSLLSKTFNMLLKQTETCENCRSKYKSYETRSQIQIKASKNQTFSM